MHCALCLFCISLLDEVFGGCFRQAFFHFGDKKVAPGCVRQVFVINSNNCMRICLVGLSIGCLKRVAVLRRWLFELLNRFDCNALS